MFFYLFTVNNKKMHAAESDDEEFQDYQTPRTMHAAESDVEDSQTPRIVEVSTPTLTLADSHSQSNSNELTSVVTSTPVDNINPPRPPYLLDNTPHRVYIVTYSQVNATIFPTRQSFGMACVRAFGGGHLVKYFCCAEEPHEHGGYHFHVSILLTESKRWLYVKKNIKDDYGVSVNFASSPEDDPFYEGAYRYCIKWDKNYFHGNVCEAHPKKTDLIGRKRGTRGEITRKANAASKKSAAKRRDEKEKEKEKKEKEKKRRKRMDKLDIMDFIVQNKLKTDEELLSMGKKRRDEYGDREVLLFLTNLGEKGRRDVMRDAWKTHTSTEVVIRQSKTRMDIVRETMSSQENCICPERGLWLILALDVCDKNGFLWKDMSNAFYDLLENGRGKHRNIILYGERNCAKTFLLEPLTNLFPNTFHTPPASNFGWLGVEEAQVIYLNDFRWKPSEKKGGSISWDALLRLLEGHNSTLPAPMNSRSEHINLLASNDIPIFCTSRALPQFYKEHENEPQTPEHHTENRMMDPERDQHDACLRREEQSGQSRLPFLFLQVCFLW